MDNCPKKDCHEPNALIFKKVVIPASVADDRVTPPKNGDYCNMLVEYEASGNVYIFSSDGIPTMISVDMGDINYAELLNKPKINNVELVGDKSLEDLGITDAINDAVADEADIRSSADQEIWTEIEAIEAGSDVVDIVGTYAELQQYDTSTLQNNDVIKVLTDETHDNAISYYRWNATTQAFTYVGSEGPYYTASETDTLLAAKQDKLIAGSNIQIAADGKTISATDTTYDVFSIGSDGLVPGPTAGDTDKYLKGDGTWATVQGGSAYTAGNGIDIDSNNEISVDTAVVATQTDLAGKQDTLTAGTNVQINNNVISATDTTYSNFVGTDGAAPGAAGLVPAPAVADDNKYLKSDGTWATVQGGGSSAPTILYHGYDSGNQFNGLYKDNQYTEPIWGDEILSLIQDGQILIYDSNFPVYMEVNSADNDDEGYVGVSTTFVFAGTHYSRVYKLDHTAPVGTPTHMECEDLNIQPALTAGANISIGTVGGVDNTISVTGMPVLYGSQGQNTDGAVTQKLFTDTVGDVESILQILNSGAGV